MSLPRLASHFLIALLTRSSATALYIDGEQGPRNMIFNVDKWGRVSTCVQMKVFRMVYVKRFIGDNYVTYPFGYQRCDV